MKEIKGVLLDIDGVLYSGDNSVPGASDTICFLEENDIQFRCLSNTTRKSRASISKRLKSYGLCIPEEYIITPASVVVSLLKKSGIRRCFFLTCGDVLDDLLEDGITGSEHDAQAVVVGDAGENFNYESMNKAFRLIDGGASFYALEKDRYWMDNDGLSLSAGPFVYGLEYATGRSACLVGKPSAAFFEKALDSMNIDPSGAVMVGDDINSDVGGSQNAGIKGVLVRTGKFDEKKLVESGVKPYRVIDSVAGLPDIICSST
ncbi:MAG: TIGR01458 family HAD-type hydrolase [Methanomicrobiaceae archaeon]|nr:TIGR01458 family HAD-type hydrolase [Methanomicrobiaceae archaeon]